MIAQVVDVPPESISGEAFNCASNRRVSYLKLLADVGACLGMDREAAKAQAAFYRPETIDLPSGAQGFPFRPQHFGVGVSKAMTTLKWKPARRLDRAALEEYLAEYRRLGRDQLPLDLRFNEAALASRQPKQATPGAVLEKTLAAA